MKVKQIKWEKSAYGGSWEGSVGCPEEGVEIYFNLWYDNHTKQRQGADYVYHLLTDSSLSEFGMDGSQIEQGVYTSLEAAQCAAQTFLEKCVQSLLEE